MVPGSQRACEILGLDPLYVANEGKLQAIVPPSEASAVLAAIPSTRAEATIIGEVTAEHPSFVLMKISHRRHPGRRSAFRRATAFAKVFLECQAGRADSLANPQKREEK